VVAGIGCFVAMFRWSDSSATYYEGGAVLWAVGAAVLLVAALPDGPLSRVLSVRPLVWLGLISYGIYVFHWPIGLWLDGSTTLDGPALFAAKVGLTLAVATASYLVVEMPIRRRRIPRPGLVAKLAAPVAIAGTAALVILLVAPLVPADQVDLAAQPDSPNTDFVITRGTPDGETAAGPALPPTSSSPPTTTEQEGILAMAALDQRMKEAEAAASAWTPPPPPPLLGQKLAQFQADKSLIPVCEGHTPPLVEYRDNGTGRLVAVIGDSMTVQMRDTILNDKEYDWFLLARCGTALFQFDHPGSAGSEGLPETLAKMLYMQPKALIIALGITDVTHHLDYGGSLPWFIDATKDVPCRSWVNLAPIQQMNRYTPGGVDEFEAFNAALANDIQGTDIRILDWSARVQAMPITSVGYHPWLNPTDWVHLIPGQGIDQRWQLMKTGLAGCF
jgi:hypothetical protein